MVIEIIKLDEYELIIKVGDTAEKCMKSKALIIPTFGIKDLYTLLINNRSLVELHVLNFNECKHITYKFPDGMIPITRLT
jgi:hypothetical protein